MRDSGFPGASLAAYSCGGSRSFALRSLFIRCLGTGTEVNGSLPGLGQSCKDVR